MSTKNDLIKMAMMAQFAKSFPNAHPEFKDECSELLRTLVAIQKSYDGTPIDFWSYPVIAKLKEPMRQWYEKGEYWPS